MQINRLPSDFTIDRYGLHVRLVCEADAEFILKLRTDEKLGRFINATKPDVGAQIAWTRAYKMREAAGEDYYFIFEIPKGSPIGLCRIYDIETDKYTTGSWLFSQTAPVGSAILADIISREIAIELFPDSTHLFDVKKENITVNRYSQTYKSVVLRTDETSNYYTCPKENFEKYKKLHIRMFAPKN